MKYNSPNYRHAEIRVMTPMIDVVFLLLVFFVCTANFKPPEGILPMDTPLPGTVSAKVVLPDPVNMDVVLIKIIFEKELHWQVADNLCTSLQEVQNILQSIQDVKADIPVIIESTDNVPMENVIDTYDICRRTGLSHIQFSVF